jgi:hypothetical protein
MRVSVQSPVNLVALSYAWNKTTALDAYKRKGHFSVFLLEAMSRGPLPTFAYHGQKHPLQKPRKWYGDFETDLREAYLKHKTKILVSSKKTTCKEARLFPKKLELLLESFGHYTPSCATVVLCPNHFGVPGEGYGPLIGKTAYAIFTPNPKKDQTWLMVHEVCHSLLLPIFQSKQTKKLIAQTAHMMPRWSTKQFRTYYPKWEWLLEEYFIHAIEQHVTGSSIKEKISWGMNRLPWFIDSWATFQELRLSNPSLSIEQWVHETLVRLKNGGKDRY